MPSIIKLQNLSNSLYALGISLIFLHSYLNWQLEATAETNKSYNKAVGSNPALSKILSWLVFLNLFSTQWFDCL